MTVKLQGPTVFSWNQRVLLTQTRKNQEVCSSNRRASNPLVLVDPTITKTIHGSWNLWNSSEIGPKLRSPNYLFRENSVPMIRRRWEDSAPSCVSVQWPCLLRITRETFQLSRSRFYWFSRNFPGWLSSIQSLSIWNKVHYARFNLESVNAAPDKKFHVLSMVKCGKSSHHFTVRAPLFKRREIFLTSAFCSSMWLR
jgi:hypothetical protein